MRSGSGRTYSVEIRGLGEGERHCTCVDFRCNGLGTCKHAEAVLRWLRRTQKSALAEARSRPSPRFDLLPDASGTGLQLRIPPAGVIPPRCTKWFDASGRLKGAVDPAEAVAALREAANAVWPRLRISQETEIWLERRALEADRATLRREYELRVQCGEWPPQETKVSLFPYQREGMLHLAFKERALLADEMGLGKTIQAIAACALLHRLGRARRVLVITPASLKGEWEEQIQRFTDLSVRVILGPHHLRLRQLREDAANTANPPFFTLMNYEQVVPVVEEVNEVFRPDVVILDEAQRIKNWNTRTALRIKQLNSRYAFVLTGTPLENRIDELRSLVDFLDPTLLGPLFRFNREYYQLNDKGRPEAYRNLASLHDRVRPILLRRRKAEVETQLPPRTDHHRHVKLTPRQRTAYGTHEQEVMRLVTLSERRPLTQKEQDLLQIELAMMRMICDTNYILDRADRDCPKLAEVEQILRDCAANGAKAIVFSEWERMLELVRELCAELGMDAAWHTGSVDQRLRRDEIRRFKDDPGCRVFLSTDAGATGLNLQNASVVVCCDLPWNPARLEQRIARAWRKNQLLPVTVYCLIAQDTIEQRMLQTLAIKREVAHRVLDDPGDGSPIALRTGRKAVADRLRELVGRPGSGGGGGPGTGEPVVTPARRDPSLTFASELRRLWGADLVRCEEQRAVDAVRLVLLAVVEGGAEVRRTEAESVFAMACPEAAAGENGLRLEVVDRATYEAICRWMEAGLLRGGTVDRRDLLALAATEGPPPLSSKEREDLERHRATARRQVQLARVLLAGGFPEETRRPVLAALDALARAVAVGSRMPEPEGIAVFLGAPGATHLKIDPVAVRRFIEGEGSPDGGFISVVEAALEQVVGARERT